MRTSELRKVVKEHVENADVRLLKMLRALAESYEDTSEKADLTEEHYQLIDKRREAHFARETRSFSWEEVQQNAKNAVGE